MAVIESPDGLSVMGVDPKFDAARVSLRPAEVTGWVSIGAKSGLVTGLAAGGAVFSLRNLSANLLMVRRVGIGFTCTTGFTAAQALDWGLIVARNFTTSDTGGTAISLVANNAKHRTSLDTFTSVDCRISTTAVLGAGTKTLDTNTLSVVNAYALATTAGNILPATQDNLLQHAAGDHPLILAQNEGINIQNLTLMGAGGVGFVYVNLEVAEATAY